jgi:RNA polymerase sigma-70 factor (ECF subfamily)
MNEERLLVDQCRKGDAQAQERLYAQFAPQMYVISLRYTRSQLEAEDVLQEAFIKIFDKIIQYKGETAIAGWIKKIVVNTALNSQRSKLYMFPMTDIEELKTHQEEELTLSGFQLEELLEMIRSLPEGCQVIFNLYAIEGYNHKEIGEQLNISEGTSKSQYARAKQLLKIMINKEERRSYGRAK